MLGLGLSGSSIVHYIIASIVQRGNGLSNLKGDRIDTASLKNLVKILLNHGLTMLSDFHKDWVKVSALQIRPRSCRPSNRKLSSKVVGSFAYQQATGTDRPPLTSQIGPTRQRAQSCIGVWRTPASSNKHEAYVYIYGLLKDVTIPYQHHSCWTPTKMSRQTGITDANASLNSPTFQCHFS